MNYGHLLALSTERGIYEHCHGQTPLPEHGYCVDDVARALIVIERDPSAPAEMTPVAQTCLEFLGIAVRRRIHRE